MKDDYSDVTFSQGLVCKNLNNNSYCVIIDGHQGSEYDKCSFVLECVGEIGFIFNTVPNRALRPTGKIFDLKRLKKKIDEYVF